MLKSDNQLNTYDYNTMEKDDFLANWHGTDVFTPAKYDKNTETEKFLKTIYHYTYNGARGWKGETTLFTRDYEWNWPQAQRFGLYIHGAETAKEGRAQDPSIPDTYAPDGARMYDAIKQMNILAGGQCNLMSSFATSLWEAWGFQARRWNIDGGYHSVAEVWYNNAWHHYDLDQAGWVMDPSGDHVMSLAEWAANPTHVQNAVYSDPPLSSARPKYFEDLDMPGWPTKLAQSWPGATSDGGNYAFHDTYEHYHDMSFALRQGESIKLYWYSQTSEYGGLGYYSQTQADYDLQMSDGDLIYDPTLSNTYNDYYDGIYEDKNIVLESDGLSASGSGAYVIWAVRSAYQMVRSAAVITATGSITKEISKDIGKTWSSFSGDNVGNVKEMYGYLLRVSVPQGSKVTDLKVTTLINHNPGHLPRLSAVNANDPALFNDYQQKVRLYTYHQDEAMESSGADDYDITTTVIAPDGGRINSISGSYRYAVPNPPANGTRYEVGLQMDAGIFANTIVKTSDDFTKSPQTWVYNYVDNSMANISIMRHALSGNPTEASMKLVRGTNTAGYTSGMYFSRIKMHYDVHHSSYAGPEPLIVSYELSGLTGDKIEDVILPTTTATSTVGPKIILKDTTSGSQISSGNGSYWELEYDLTGIPGNRGLINWSVTMENPGMKPFAPRSTGFGGTGTQKGAAAASPSMSNAPNPFNPITTLTFSNPNKNADIYIYNVHGKLVSSFKNLKINKLNWNAAGFGNGIYLIKLKTNGSVLIHKVSILK